MPCDQTYVGETGRKFGVSLQEHRTEVEAKTTRTFTRSQRVSSLSEHNKSALTDHAAQENHMINWSEAMVIDREPVRFSRWIKEAVHIRKKANMLWIGTRAATQSRLPPLSWHGIVQSCQEPAELSTSFFWWRPLIEVETSILGNYFGCVWWIIIVNNFPT